SLLIGVLFKGRDRIASQSARTKTLAAIRCDFHNTPQSPAAPYAAVDWHPLAFIDVKRGRPPDPTCCTWDCRPLELDGRDGPRDTAGRVSPPDHNAELQYGRRQPQRGRGRFHTLA